MMLSKIFSKENVNLTRQTELDIAKCVAMLFLPFVHIFIEGSSEEMLLEGLPYLFDTVIGGPLSAPVFIFCMGVGLVYSKKTSFSEYINRALVLFGLGFILNILRYFIPHFMAYFLVGEAEHLINPLIYKFFRIDILQFAGLALLLLAILIKLKVKDLFIFLFALALSISGNFLAYRDTGNIPLDIFLSFFVGIIDESNNLMNEFVLFNWFIVLVLGYLYGKLLIKIKDKDLFYKITTIPCLIYGIIYFTTGVITKRGLFGFGEYCYYFISTFDAFSAIISNFGLFGVYYFISKHMSEKSKKITYKCSSCLTTFYVIHWIIIGLVFKFGLY